MKKIIAVLIGLAILLLGGYYGMGLITERTVKKNIAMINQSHDISAEVKQYHRGFFCSTAVLNWSFHIPERMTKNQDGQAVTIAAQTYQVELPLTIHHGPILLANSNIYFGLGFAKSSVVLPKKYADELKANFSSESIPPLLNLTMFVNYWNKSTVQMTVPFFKLLSNDKRSQFEWLGATSDVNVSSDASDMSGHVVMSGVRFLKGKIDTVLGNVRTEYQLHRSKLGLYLGDATILMRSLLITNDSKTVLEVKNVDVRSSSNVLNDLFHSHFQAKIEKVFADDKQYGPALVDFSVDNLDAITLAKLNEQASVMQHSSDVQRQQLLVAMLPELPKLLSKGAQLSIKQLSIGMPEGVVRGHLFVSLPKADTGNPFQLIQQIKGDGKFEIPMAFLKRVLNESIRQTLQNKAQAKTALSATTEQAASLSAESTDLNQQALMQTDAQLAAIVTSGALLVHDADYVIELALSKGQLLINGKPFNSAMIPF